MSVQDFVQNGVNWLHEKRKRWIVESVAYTRGNVTEMMYATVARAGSPVDEYTILLTSREQDFVIDPLDLQSMGIDKPERGDLITRYVSSKQITYEVTGRDGESPQRHTDRYRLAWRVHTVRTSEVDN